MSQAAKESLTEQRTYTTEFSETHKLGLIVPEAFVRGIRHLGYKSNVEAIAELVDNSIQAYAEHICLFLAFEDSTSSAKPTQLAVVDDGHGMSPEMLRLAMMWGGTHRENDRNGLGRFGYGLPCATVSIGRRFTIYSKVRGGKLYAINLDLDQLDNGAYRDGDSGINIPIARPASLPKFVRKAILLSHPHGWRSGTVVVIDKLDRLEWATANGLKRNLIRHFGVAYHKLLASTEIYIDGDQVRPIDPLFLSPEGEFHALDDDRARALDPVTLKITDDGRFSGQVTLRYAWLPPTFGATDKSRDAIGLNANARFPILKQYHGIVFSRNGRVIDVQSRTPWTTFINNDRYIRVEIEFSASLDEGFGVTTSKQQVTVSPEMWDRLREAGLPKAIEHLRAKVRMEKTERLRMMAPLPNKPVEHRNALSSDDRADLLAGHTLSARERDAKRNELSLIVTNILESTGKARALCKLLTRIERRMRCGKSEVVSEYDRLLRGWARELSRNPNR